MSEKKTVVLPVSDGAIAYAADIIKRGGLVAFPTETVYGLGASAYYPGAAKKIYEAKGRPSDNPLIVHVSEPNEAEDFAVVQSEFYRLAERFMPGPLTVVLKKTEKIDPSVTGGLDTVAVRCPEHPAARALIKASGCPIAAPSANRSGSPSPTEAAHVLADLDGRIDAIIDGGPCRVGVESTVISLDGDGGCTILRPGDVTADMLAEVMRSVRIAGAVTDPSLSGDRPLSPGMKYKHYSPRAEVIAYEGALEEMIDAANCDPAPRVGAIVPDGYADQVKGTALLSGDGGADDMCHAFFSLLRQADELSLDRVYVRVPPKTGKFLALYNRLIRAAGGKITTPEN
ncbi:MAG: threonylcarbamoyl-AMP synthase [Clostridia bacterium]|nr:threonylcarbamoyl-AMP synthase [Clostridia bacterium]